MKKIVILYHSDCSDGFGAAWAAWRKFGVRADYLAVKHQEPPPKGLRGKKIYQLDFTYFGLELKRLLKNNRVTTIDHHISVKGEIKSVHDYIFDNRHSGAVLAWNFFHPGKDVPKLLSYVEDRDLWKFKLPGSRAMTLIVDLLDYDFLAWNKIAADLEKPQIRKKYIHEGNTILKYQNNSVAKLMNKTDIAIFEGRRIWVVNSPGLKSEIGNKLVQKRFPVALIWHRQGSNIYVSLRSDGSIDVSKLAKHYGGGGHKASAGFTYPAKLKLPWKYLSK